MKEKTIAPNIPYTSFSLNRKKLMRAYGITNYMYLHNKSDWDVISESIGNWPFPSSRMCLKDGDS